MKRIFFGPQGLRAGWGLLLFLVIQQGLLAAIGVIAVLFWAFHRRYREVKYRASLWSFR